MTILIAVGVAVVPVVLVAVGIIVVLLVLVAVVPVVLVAVGVAVVTRCAMTCTTELPCKPDPEHAGRSSIRWRRTLRWSPVRRRAGQRLRQRPA
jgi:fatty acid desaturase